MYTDQQLVDLQQTLYESSNPTRKWLHCSRRDWIIKQIKELEHPVVNALEVGPGSGVYLPVLADIANNVVASDVEDAYLVHARQLSGELSNLVCVRDDITRPTLRVASFDLILCTEVIEHIPDVTASLQGLSKLLAPGGTLILSTPQRYSPLELCAKVAFLPGVIQIVRWIYKEPIIETGHISLQTEKQLAKALAHTGLTTITVRKSGFYLPLVAEFMGESGQRFLSWCERGLQDSFASGLLWTQYWILRKER